MDIKELTALYLRQSDGSYVASVVEIEGINTQWATLQEAEENLHDAAKMMIQYRREQAMLQQNAIRKPFVLTS